MIKENRGIIKIRKNSRVLAIVIRANHIVEDIEFFTQNEHALQVGIHNKVAQAVVAPHVHIEHEKLIKQMSEVFFIINGKAKVTVYDQDTEKKIESVIVKTGDTFIQLSEGHGLEFMEDTRMLEVKQGPYVDRTTYKRIFKKVA